MILNNGMRLFLKKSESCFNCDEAILLNENGEMELCCAADEKEYQKCKMQNKVIHAKEVVERKMTSMKAKGSQNES